MQHMKTVQVPATTKEDVDRTACDFCGANIEQRRYDRDDVTLAHEAGVFYPEIGTGNRTMVDCCGNCWRGKVLPALRVMGANERTEDISF